MTKKVIAKLADNLMELLEDLEKYNNINEYPNIVERVSTEIIIKYGKGKLETCTKILGISEKTFKTKITKLFGSTNILEYHAIRENLRKNDGK